MENTGDIQTFINTSSLTTFASVDQTESKSTTTSATTTSTTLSTTTSKVRTTTKLPTTKTTAITTTTKSIAITNRTTTSKLPTTTTSPTRSRRPSINKGKQLHTGKLIMPPPPPPVSINFPYGKGPTFFSKFNKFLGTRKRPRITAAASSPYTRVHNRGPYTTVSVGSKRLRKTTTTESPHIKVHNRRPHTTASVQNKGLHKTTTTESPFTRIQKKRTHTTENVQNKGLRISTTTVSPYIRAQNRRPHTTENVQNKGLHISTTTVSPYVNRKQNAGRVEEQKPRSVITTLSPAKNAESGQGQNRSTLGSVHSISESTPKSVNDRKPTTESLPIVTSSKKEAKTKDAVSTKTKPAKVPRPSEEVIPDVVPYLIFFPDERNDKYEGFSKNPPNKLEIKKPKISFRSRTTSATHVVDPPRKAKEKLDITQRKFFGNFSSNMNLKLNRKTPKEESYTKIKMKEHGPTSHPLSASLNKIKTNVEGNSSSNFKVTQFNNTQVGKDGGKIYMDENLPTFEPYVPNNETNSTDLYTEVKNVVHHNFVLNGLIENMGTLLKNGESKIHFLLKGNRERDKSKRKPIKATENVQLVDGNFIPTQEQEKLTNPQGEETRPKGEVTRSRDLIKSQDVQNKMAGNQDLTHSQRDAQVNIDLDNTLSENTKKQRTAKEKMNPVEFSAKNVNVFKGNSAISRKAENIETTTSKTVHQTVRPFPAHMTRLRPTNQSKDRKVMSALMSFPPPPPPSPIYYKNLNKKTPSNPSPAKRDQTSRDVIGTIPPEINRAEKKTTVKFPPVPSIYPSNERSPIPAPTPIRVKTTNPTKVTTTTAPPTTTQKTTTRAPKTVTPNLYYPTIPRGLTTTVYKISQIFFPPDFTQRRSLTDIINADPNKVPGTYTKTVYPPTLKQINATDVMLSTPYHVKDSVSKVPLLTSGTTVSTVRQKAPGIKGLPRNIKQTESESTSSPYLRSKLEVPDPFTTGNNDITTQSESPHVFKHANGSALTTNVRKQTKEVKTFRNVGINILKEIFKSPKVKKQDVLSGKVKLPQGKNAVILDIGLMNKIMDTFRRWLASMKLLVVEK
ncbi:mucin-2-like [Saccostrea echinata]|uniref:mucin-2-like n=1 Tax=Saccostrea echinata TaxID=191078 RepID=UPI002A8185E5|nr:mucin-2-like [Saccostrea echinata]